MAQIIFNIPDTELNRVVDCITGQYNYQPVINGQPNPETKGVFTKRMIKHFIINTVRAYETNKIVDSTRTTELAKSDPTVT